MVRSKDVLHENKYLFLLLFYIQVISSFHFLLNPISPYPGLNNFYGIYKTKDEPLQFEINM
jgi:hypothetical protein